MEYPCGGNTDIICSKHNCGSCGFNPKEAHRRLVEGQHIKRKVKHSYTNDNGITHTITREVDTIVFRRRENVT